MITSFIVREDESNRPSYIAVTKHGFAIHELPAMAIWRAHEFIPDNAKPTQLLLYKSSSAVGPVGFKDGGPIWPNGQRVSLVGLTATGRIFRQRPTIA